MSQITEQLDRDPITGDHIVRFLHDEETLEFRVATELEANLLELRKQANAHFHPEMKSSAQLLGLE